MLTRMLSSQNLTAKVSPEDSSRKGKNDGAESPPIAIEEVDQWANENPMIDAKGEGTIVTLMRKAYSSGDHSDLNSYIEGVIPRFTYNQGKGKVVPIAELIKIRNKNRNAKLGAFSRKKGRGKSGPNILEDFNQETANAGDLQKALKRLDGGGKGGRGGDSKYREICWSLDHRGEFGGSLAAQCLRFGTVIHNLLAMKLIDAYPKLLNDISVSEEYYGMTLLHMAIVNEDCHMVSKLLIRGADVNQRCFGSFFCAEDQINSRSDSMEHEYVDLNMNSHYTGHMYFGEYPLSFAVCMGSVDIFRLLLAKKAKINGQDTNGNTALHLCVIHERMDMMRLCIENGASIQIMNKQNLTPLTLAAKLAKKNMFAAILELECETVWSYGDASCIAYPLEKVVHDNIQLKIIIFPIDTINETTGSINENSVLSLVVYGATPEHLGMLDGLLDHVLEKKWMEYGFRRWIQTLLYFTAYYIILTTAFMLRPSSATTEHITKGMINRQGVYQNTSMSSALFQNETYSWKKDDTQCHLLDYGYDKIEQTQWMRFVCELGVLVCVFFQIITDLHEISIIGKQKWFSIMRAFPAKLLYKASWFFIILAVPFRLSCGVHDGFLYVENTLATLAIVLSTLHFLYFFRAIKFVGPFVLMVYSIIATDLSRFILIYCIFLVGFSQAFYMVFNTCESAAIANKAANLFTEFENVMHNPIDAFIRTFIMTIGEFGVLYREMSACDSAHMRYIGKTLFVVFELSVSVLQFNLLIAMMTRTYETIFLTQKEWRRQWAQVILMLEMSMTPRERLEHLLKYSRPTGTNKQIRSYVVSDRACFHKSEEEQLIIREEKAEKLREARREYLWKRTKEVELQLQRAKQVLERMIVVPRRERLLRQSTVN